MWGVILGASILTWALCFPVRRILVWFGFWDVSNDRSCHAGRIIRGGGLAPTTVILLSLGLWGNSAAPQIGYVWVACLILLALINVTDDFRGLPVKVRLAGQLLVAVVSAWAILSGDWGIIEIAGGALLLMTLMNFFNFLDGINGLIPTQVVVITLGLILLGGNSIANEGIMACVIGGAALGTETNGDSDFHVSRIGIFVQIGQAFHRQVSDAAVDVDVHKVSTRSLSKIYNSRRVRENTIIWAWQNGRFIP